MLGRRIARHGFAIVATVLLGGLLSTALVRLAPGFDVDEAQLDPHLNSASVQALRQTRLEQHNIFRFYLHSLQRAVHGDLGTSLSLGQPVSTLLRERAPLTLRLVGIGLLLSWTVAMALALSAAWLARIDVRRSHHGDQRNFFVHSGSSTGAVIRALECTGSSGHRAHRISAGLSLRPQSSGQGLFPASHHYRSRQGSERVANSVLARGPGRWAAIASGCRRVGKYRGRSGHSSRSIVRTGGCRSVGMAGGTGPRSSLANEFHHSGDARNLAG